MEKSNSTGWFGRSSQVPGGVGLHTKVHYIKPNGKCACGYRPHPTMSYQWCASGLEHRYLECPRCKAWANRKAARVNRRNERALPKPKVASKTRFLDDPNELRIHLRKTAVLQTGHSFFHEASPVEEQVVTATAMPDGDIHVTLFLSKMKKLLKKVGCS